MMPTRDGWHIDNIGTLGGGNEVFKELGALDGSGMRVGDDVHSTVESDRKSDRSSLHGTCDRRGDARDWMSGFS